uniref:Uncharacterized protein n=1 Tax=Anolis carolinensis TaxID=28377 RepID=A0A803U0J8_ANOCA
MYVGERKGVAVGVLTQPVAYLFKQSDNVACGWPSCLRAVAAAAFLVEEVNKLTLGQPVIFKMSPCSSDFNGTKGTPLAHQ